MIERAIEVGVISITIDDSVKSLKKRCNNQRSSKKEGHLTLILLKHNNA